jgi:hypothetical protein
MCGWKRRSNSVVDSGDCFAYRGMECQSLGPPQPSCEMIGRTGILPVSLLTGTNLSNLKCK